MGCSHERGLKREAPYVHVYLYDPPHNNLFHFFHQDRAARADSTPLDLSSPWTRAAFPPPPQRLGALRAERPRETRPTSGLEQSAGAVTSFREVSRFSTRGTRSATATSRTCSLRRARTRGGMDIRRSLMPPYYSISHATIQSTLPMQRMPPLPPHDIPTRSPCLYMRVCLSQASSKIWADIRSGAAIENPSLLTRFTLLCYADLKAYRFHYWRVANKVLHCCASVASTLHSRLYVCATWSSI